MSTERNILPERKKVKSTLEDFKLNVLLYETKKSLVWVVLLLIVALFSAFFYLRHTPYIYESKSTLMRKVVKQTKLLGVEELLSEDKTEIDIEIQLLKSKLVIAEAIKGLPLEIEYYSKGAISNTQYYENAPFKIEFEQIDDNIKNTEVELNFSDQNKVLVSYEFNGEVFSELFQIGSKIKTPHFEAKLINVNKKKVSLNSKYIIIYRNFTDVVTELSKQIKVTPLNFNSKTVNISLESTLPEKAQDIVKHLANYYIIFDTERKAESIDQTLSFLNEQIENFGKQYFNIQDTLKQFKLETGFIEPATQIQKSVEEITLLEKKNLLIASYKNGLEWMQDFLNSDDDVSNLTNLVFTDDNVNFENSISEIVKLQSQRNQKLLNVTPDHPDILLINKEVQTLKNSLLNQVGLAIEKAKLEKQENKERINELYSMLYDLPDREIDFSKLKRENDSKQQFYLNLIEQKNLYEISRAGIISDYIILEAANLPKKPIAPNDMMIWAFALILTLFLSITIIALKYIFNQKVHSLQEIEDNTNAKLLGAIPNYSRKLETSQIVVTENIKSSISESFRLLRSNLEFINSEKRPKVVATTSTVPGEGKTFVGLNLAAIYSLLDKKVIILDFDLRKPRIAHAFNVDGQKGLSSILIGRSSLEDCIYNTGIANLDFIPSGPVPPNPSELIAKKEVDELIETLKESYDYIFIDTPPSGIVTDSLALLKKADYPIYVVRAGYSERNYLENINKLIFDNGIKDLSVVLNGFGTGASGAVPYGYGYGYGYSNGMGYYSDDIAKPENILTRLINKIRGK